MKYDHLLPIGSMVKIVGEEYRVLVIGSNVQDGKGQFFDYCGCFYPVGYLGPDRICSFNHTDIETIYSVGYLDEESRENQKTEEEINRRERGNTAGV